MNHYKQHAKIAEISGFALVSTSLQIDNRSAKDLFFIL